MATVSDIIKNAFYILLFLQIAPVLIKGIRNNYNDILSSKAKIGVLSIEGTLNSASPILKDVKKLFENPSIKGILLKVNSPGGIAGTAQTIFKEILYFKKENPDKYVICFVENIAASGGFYVACAADYIITSPSAFIGSIGAYIQHPLFKDFIEKHNIHYNVVKAGSYKTAGNPFLALTPEQTELFQSLTDNTYNQFVRDVALRRPHLPADTKAWADGKIFTGEQALQLHLIDALGSPSDTLKLFREKGHFEGDIEWIKPAKRPSGFRALFGQEDDEDGNSSYLETCLKTVCSFLETRYRSFISY
ncbi:signal peptide peptidase SppA [Candidatus Dependentiae bacterium]|nr:signal peptide peptidase SppA [Candidatus Dependentiae bacterium]